MFCAREYISKARYSWSLDEGTWAGRCARGHIGGQEYVLGLCRRVRVRAAVQNMSVGAQPCFGALWRTPCWYARIGGAGRWALIRVCGIME